MLLSRLVRIMQRAIKFLVDNQFLLLIVILGAILRLYGLSWTPPSLNWDEASLGYNAYSILKTGRDEWGETFPITFRAYGDYKLPVYVYATALSEFFFGLNEFAVRLPSVLAGLTTIIFTYLLSRKLFNKYVGIFASMLVAIEPWTLFLSRSALESNFSTPFIIGGLYFFVSSFEKPKLLVYSGVLLGLSVWTYNSARIFVPMFFLLLCALYKNELREIWKRHKATFTFHLLTFALFLIPMFWQLTHPIGQARYEKVAILNDGAIAEINSVRTHSQLPLSLTRLVYNRPVYLVAHFVKNWVLHFSPEFLFFKGGTQFNYSVPGYGLIYPVNAFLLLLGLLYLIRQKNKITWLFLGWLVLAPIPSSLTREAPHVLRATTMLPLPMILSALGVWVAWQWWKMESGRWKIEKFLRFIPSVIYFVVLAVLLENYLTTYFGKYRKNYSWSWQYGYKEVVEYARNYYGEYDKIIVTKKYGEPHEFFLFYWPWDPGKYRNDPNLIRFQQSGWFWVDRFNKFYFVNDWGVPKVENGKWKMESGGEIPINKKTLLITSPGNYPPNWKLLKTVDFLDGKPAFDILETI